LFISGVPEGEGEVCRVGSEEEREEGSLEGREMRIFVRKLFFLAHLPVYFTSL